MLKESHSQQVLPELLKVALLMPHKSKLLRCPLALQTNQLVVGSTLLSMTSPLSLISQQAEVLEDTMEQLGKVVLSHTRSSTEPKITKNISEIMNEISVRELG